jgi:hypothetical protein
METKQALLSQEYVKWQTQNLNIKKIFAEATKQPFLPK